MMVASLSQEKSMGRLSQARDITDGCIGMSATFTGCCIRTVPPCPFPSNPTETGTSANSKRRATVRWMLPPGLSSMNGSISTE